MPRATSNLEYRDGSLTLRGYLATPPELAAPAPGVLVVHEADGVGPHVKRRAEMLAELGYVALAVDMFGDGRTAGNLPDAIAMMHGVMDDPRVWRARIGAALTALCALRDVDATRVAAIGYCFGGSTVLELARTGADVRGVVSFHGGLDTAHPDDAERIKGKVLICTGDSDPFVPRERVNETQDRLAAAGVDYQVITYGGAKHSFTNPDAGELGNPGLAYDERTDRRSWAAMRDFFAEAFA